MCGDGNEPDSAVLLYSVAEILAELRRANELLSAIALRETKFKLRIKEGRDGMA